MPLSLSKQPPIAPGHAAGRTVAPRATPMDTLVRGLGSVAADPVQARELAQSILAGLAHGTLDLQSCEVRHPGLPYDLDPQAWQALESLVHATGAPGITALSLPEATDAAQLRACIEELNALAHLRTLTVRVPVEGRLVDLRGLRHPPRQLQVRLACWRPAHWVVYAPKGMRIHAQGNEGLATPGAGAGLSVHRFGDQGLPGTAA